MSEYEELKTMMMTNLHTDYGIDTETIKKVCDCLDTISTRYVVRRQDDIAQIQCCNGDILKQYITAKEVEGCAAGTVKNYRYILTLFFDYVQKDIKEIEAVDIRKFLREYKEDRNVADCSLDKYREAIVWFFSWCHEEGLVTVNPTHNLKPIKYEEKERKALTRLELEIFRNSCETVRERAIVEFLYSTACRVSELCNVKKSDINLHEQTVKIFGKGKRERTSWINAKCLVAISQYLESRDDDSEWLFVNQNKPHGKCSGTSIERLIKKIQQRSCGIPFKVTPHIMRHSSATHALQSGMDIAEISKFLGHKRLETTMRYAHVSTDDVMLAHRKHVV